MSDREAEAANPSGGVESANTKAEISGLNRRNSELERALSAERERHASELATERAKHSNLDSLLARLEERSALLDSRERALGLAVEGKIDPSLAVALATTDQGETARRVGALIAEIRRAADAKTNERLAANAPRPMAGDTSRVLNWQAIRQMTPAEIARIPPDIVSRALRGAKPEQLASDFGIGGNR